MLILELCLSTGLAFLPASVSYLIGINLFGVLANKMGRYVVLESVESNRNVRWESLFEVVPAPSIRNSFSEVESLGQVHMDKSCLQGG